MTKEKTQNESFNPWLVYAVCFAVSLVFMFFFGSNSPIHTFNPQCDYNWYLTMGRGILEGKVPYRDLFDHKGPITYFLFAFAALFPNPQIAVWLIEIVCISLFLYFSYRIARKFLSPWLSLAVVPLMMMILSANFCRLLNGSCVEEFCLPIFAYGLLCFLDFIMDNRAATWRRSLAIGICLGILFWVKFSMLEFFFVPMLIWLIINLVRHRIKEVLKSGLIMLGGLLIVSFPNIIYFVATGTLGDLWDMYFKLNIGSYSGNYSGLSEFEMFIRKWKNSLWIFTLGAYFIFIFVLGLVCFAVQFWRQKSGWLMLVSVVPTWLLTGFFCGFEHYYIPFFTYTVLGVIYLVKYIAKFILCKFKTIESKVQYLWFKNLILGLVVCISFFMALPFVLNIADINRPRENYAPLVVADIINEYNETAEKPATLFCYNMIDYGFYNALGTIPVKYFARSAFMPDVFPEMFEAFDETIRNQTCDFVVVCDYGFFGEQKTLLLEYYDFYNGTLEDSTIKYSYFDDKVEYTGVNFILMFRRDL